MLLDVSVVIYLRVSPGESWAGSPPNPLVRLRERWGCHKESKEFDGWRMKNKQA